MNKTILATLLIALVLIFGCTEAPVTTDTNNMTDVNNEVQETYTLAEVSEHATADDCWFVINGDVYDVTEYIAKGIHPGGEAILNGCGKDATQMFGSIKDGEGHPMSAQNFAKQYIIGKLA